MNMYGETIALATVAEADLVLADLERAAGYLDDASVTSDHGPIRSTRVVGERGRPAPASPPPASVP